MPPSYSVQGTTKETKYNQKLSTYYYGTTLTISYDTTCFVQIKAEDSKLITRFYNCCDPKKVKWISYEYVSVN